MADSALIALLIPVAHAGHWVLYLAPVAVVLVAVVASALHERRTRLSVDDDDLGGGRR